MNRSPLPIVARLPVPCVRMWLRVRTALVSVSVHGWICGRVRHLCSTLSIVRLKRTESKSQHSPQTVRPTQVFAALSPRDGDMSVAMGMA